MKPILVIKISKTIVLHQLRRKTMSAKDLVKALKRRNPIKKKLMRKGQN